jgi:hypothetical protein
VTRDFSRATVARLCEVIAAVRSDNQWRVADFFTDLWEALPPLDQVEAYRRAVLDKYDIAESELDNILRAVGAVDEDHARQLTTLSDEAEALARRIRNLADMVTPQVISSTPSRYAALADRIDSNYNTIHESSARESRGREIAQHLADQQMTDQDWGDLAALADNPYFAAALANACPPEILAQAALDLSFQYQAYLQDQTSEYAAYLAQGDDQPFAAWAAERADAYQRKLESLGVALGAATRSGRLNQGYVDQVIAVFQQPGSLPAAMGVVLGHGVYEAGFAHTVAEGVYDYERGMIDDRELPNYYLVDPDDPGLSLYYDIWSNIHYGYVGASAGYPGMMLMEGQKREGTSDAIDDLTVSIGFELAEKYPPGTLTPQALQQAIDDHMFDFLSAATVPPASQVRINV